MLNRRSLNLSTLPRSHNTSLKAHHPLKQNSIPLIQRKSVSLNPKQITSRLQDTIVKPKPNASNFLQQKPPLVSTVSRNQVVQKVGKSRNIGNQQFIPQKLLYRKTKNIVNKSSLNPQSISKNHLICSSDRNLRI